MRHILPILVSIVVLSGCTCRVNEIGESHPEGMAYPPGTFPSAQDAVTALRQALVAEDRGALLAVLGSDASDILTSGDAVDDRNVIKDFSEKLGKHQALEAQPDGSYLLLVGENEWPFSIPIVSDGGEYYFDIDAGKEELLNRRIGENELRTIRFIHAFVEAQKAYIRKDHDGDRVREYATKGISTPGKHDGLYWASSEQKEQSPLGLLAAQAYAQGYRKQDDGQRPFHGYYFKILMAQGNNAQGGHISYLDKHGNLTKGFGLLAYPARYDSSGIMSFVVNNEGVIYEKDLGVQTLSTAENMTEFDPDPNWHIAVDPLADEVEDETDN